MSEAPAVMDRYSEAHDGVHLNRTRIMVIAIMVLVLPRQLALGADRGGATGTIGT